MCLVQECVKFIVFAFNLIFVIVGAALITVGTIYQVHFTDVTKAIPDPYSHLQLIPILTIVVGCVIFLIAFFGCCGAIRGSPCLLTTYAVVLLVIFILQIALGVFAFIEIKNEDDFKKNVDKTIDEVFHKSDNASVEVTNFIQSELKCCGTYGPDFWGSIGKKIPDSCYSDDSPKAVYKDGCQKDFFDFLKKSAQIIGIVVLALAATEVVGATFSLCLSNSIRNEQRRGGYY